MSGYPAISVASRDNVPTPRQVAVVVPSQTEFRQTSRRPPGARTASEVPPAFKLSDAERQLLELTVVGVGARSPLSALATTPSFRTQKFSDFGFHGKPARTN
jgi:hypothetical protein